MKKAILYARVSTEEQKENGFSLQDQVQRMQKHCSNKGYDIIEVLEEDHSAKNFKRPTFQKFLNELKEGNREPDIFLCVRPDRFSRNMMASFEMLSTLLKYNVTVEFLEQHIDSDNPEDLLMKAIYHVLPEIDNKRRSINVRRGMRQASREGRWMGSPLKGYGMVKEDGLKLMTKNNDAVFIEEIFQDFAKGIYNMEEVRKAQWQKGFKVSKNQMKQILSNICYTGKIVIKAWKDEPEEIVNGAHEPIISMKTFNRVQDILHGRRTQPTGKSTRVEQFPLRGYLQCCKCGKNLTGSGSKSRSGKKHYYYHCQKGCKERYKSEDVNQAFQNYLKSFQLPDEIMTLYYFVMEDIFKQEDLDSVKQLESFQKQLKVVEGRLESVEDSFFDKVINEPEYKRAKKRYQDQSFELCRNISLLKNQKSNFQKYMDFGFSLIQNLDTYYKDSELPVKQKIVSSIFPEKLVYENQKYRTTKPNPILELITMNINELGAIKKDSQEINLEESYLVNPQGLEP